MTKILYVASTYGHLRSFHMPYIKKLSEMGYEVHVAGKGKCDIPGANRALEFDFEKKLLTLKNIRVTRRIMRVLKQERYDIISVHTALAAFYVRLAVLLSGIHSNAKVINTVHGYLFDDNTPFLKRQLLLSAEKLTAPVTDMLLVMNRQDYAIAERYKLYRGKLALVPGMGIDFKRFNAVSLYAEPRKTGEWLALRDRTRRELGLCEDDRVFVYAAEFSGRKRQDFLIRAFGALEKSNFKLLLAGTGENLQACKELASQMGVDDRVCFAGYRTDMEDLYRASDICISSSRSEGLPFNIMEAMAAGLPVCATRVKGHEDLIQPCINGWLYDYENMSELMSMLGIIDRTLTDGQGIEKIAWANIEKAKGLGIDAVRDMYLRVFLCEMCEN